LKTQKPACGALKWRIKIELCPPSRRRQAAPARGLPPAVLASVFFLILSAASAGCRISSATHFKVDGREMQLESGGSAQNGSPANSTASAGSIYSTEAPACFELGPEGLVPALRDRAADNKATSSAGRGSQSPKSDQGRGPQLAATALRVAALASADGSHSAAAIALNRFGYALLDIEPDGTHYRLRSFPLTASKFLSTSNIWPWNGGFLLELYRDPFAGGTDVSGNGLDAPTISSAGQELHAIDLQNGQSRSLPRIGSGREELFALQPSSGLWYAELREDPPSGKEAVKLSYFALSSPEMQTADQHSGKGGAGQYSRFALSQDIFEKTIAPQALAAAPKALKAAAAAAAPGTLLIHQKGGPEIESYWLRGSSLADARPASAWVSIDGQAAFLLEENGEAISAIQGPDTIKRFKLSLPLEGLKFRSIAIIKAGSQSLLIASYEAGGFTRISRSGIAILPLEN